MLPHDMHHDNFHDTTSRRIATIDIHDVQHYLQAGTWYLVIDTDNIYVRNAYYHSTHIYS